jgi:phosphate-selective porin OprO/OprP
MLTRRLNQAEAEIRELRSAQAESASMQASFAQPEQQGTIIDDLRNDLNALRKSYFDDKNVLPRIKVNGVFQADQGWFDQDANSIHTFGTNLGGGPGATSSLFPGNATPVQPNGGRIQDGGDFRRARLAASGQVTENMNGFFQMDFAFFGRPTFTDVWAEYTALPIGTARIGQWKQPFSLEVVSSFRYTTFAERSVLFQAFAPFRHLGAGIYNSWGDNLDGTYAVSVYKAGQDQFGDSLSTSGGNAVTTRETWCPYYDEPSGGRYYLHLGGGYAFTDPQNNLARFRTSPEIYIGEVSATSSSIGTSGQNVSGLANGTPFFVDTGNIRTRGYHLWGTELLWTHGPLSVQQETMAVSVPQTVGPTLGYWGQYTTVGYFLTGEHRPYDRKLGVIDRVIPFEDFFRLRTQGRGKIATGIGAWEVASRVSYLNLNGGAITNPNGVGSATITNWNSTGGGGQLADVTFGLNWYMNPYSKFQFNYIRAQLYNNVFGYSKTDIFDLRYQMDF